MVETKIFKIADENAPELLFAAEVIRNGGLVVFPTETVYGLGANALSPEAAKKIYAAKGRPSDNPLIIHVSDPADAEKYTYTDELYYKLAEHFMPGPLTVVMRSRDIVPLETRGSLKTVAVRCPENKIANKLIKLAGVPIAAPSANLSGSPSPTNAPHVIEDMQGRVDIILDGGSSDFGLESTIVKIEDDGTLTLLRPGKITPSQLRAIGIDVRVADSVLEGLKDGEIALSPGMKYKHYAPTTPLTLLDGERDDVLCFLKEKAGQNIAAFVFSEDMEYYSSALSGVTLYTFGSRLDEESQAKALFSLLRDADKGGHSALFAPLPATEGIGLALYNRMIRAAAHNIKKL